MASGAHNVTFEATFEIGRPPLALKIRSSFAYLIWRRSKMVGKKQPGRIPNFDKAIGVAKTSISSLFQAETLDLNVWSLFCSV